MIPPYSPFSGTIMTHFGSVLFFKYESQSWYTLALSSMNTLHGFSEIMVAFFLKYYLVIY